MPTKTTSSDAYLAQYRLPKLKFEYDEWTYDSVKRVWKELRRQNYHEAHYFANQALQEQRVFPAEERAALLAGLAAAELRLGSTAAAKRHAGKAIELFPNQAAAHRILLTVLAANRAYKACYMHLSTLRKGPTSIWDEPLSKSEKNTALAAWAWLLGQWDLVAKHLRAAYPKGVSTMPDEVQEDWFRLSLYRDRPEDAVAVASVLIADRSIDFADEMLQTFVQNGWTAQALPLYRNAYRREPKSQLLRRRLVALCIREGQLDEARRLAKPGALDVAA